MPSLPTLPTSGALSACARACVRTPMCTGVVGRVGRVGRGVSSLLSLLGLSSPHLTRNGGESVGRGTGAARGSSLLPSPLPCSKAGSRSSWGIRWGNWPVEVSGPEIVRRRVSNGGKKAGVASDATASGGIQVAAICTVVPAATRAAGAPAPAFACRKSSRAVARFYSTYGNYEPIRTGPPPTPPTHEGPVRHGVIFLRVISAVPSVHCVRGAVARRNDMAGAGRGA